MDQPTNPVPSQPADKNQATDFVRKTVGQSAEAPIMPQLATEIKKPQSGGLKGFYYENRFYVWAILAGIVIIAVLAFFAFRKTAAPAPKEANVSISVDVPQTAPAGGQTVYKITVANNDTQTLTGLSLELGYDGGMSFLTSSPNPQNLSGTQFNVPNLTPGQNAAISVKVQLSGSVNDSKTLSIKLHYQYQNFNAQFTKDQVASVRLTASDVSLDLTGPSTANNGEIAIYTLHYQNNAQNAIAAARVKLNYPDGFNFASADPAPDSGTNTWDINNLAAGGSGTISIQGSFASANPGENKTITADLLAQGQDGQYYVQSSSAPFVTSIGSTPLMVSQQLQNASSNGVVNPGDTLNFSIKYQNNSSVVATGVNVLVTLDSKALDLSSIQAEGAQVSNNTILWNAASAAALGSLNPNDTGQLSFSVNVKNPATKDSSKNLTVVSSVKIKSNEYQNYFPGSPVSLKIAGPMKLTTALAYQSGPLPPQVGKPTLYAVTLSLTNTTDDFTGGTLTAFIPLGAGGFVSGSTNSAEAGNAQFDPTTGKLTWQVGPLPAHTGQFSAARTLQFGLKLIPSASQAGDTPTLVKTIQFSASDSFTSQTVNASADNITTGSVPEDFGQNGTVQ